MSSPSRASQLRGVLLRPESGSHPSPLPSQPPQGSGAEPSDVVTLIEDLSELTMQLWRDGKLSLDGFVPRGALRAEWDEPDWRAEVERYYRTRYGA